MAPLRTVNPGPHLRDGLVLSLWEYHAAQAEVDDLEHAAAHAALVSLLHSYEGTLPHSVEPIHACRDAASSGELCALPSGSARGLLREAFSTLDTLEIPSHEVPLHGAPHVGNLVKSGGTPLWLDLKAVCMAPWNGTSRCSRSPSTRRRRTHGSWPSFVCFEARASWSGARRRQPRRPQNTRPLRSIWSFSPRASAPSAECGAAPSRHQLGGDAGARFSPRAIV